MVRVTGIDHLVIRVSDFDKSKNFYSRLFTFLGFEISDEYDDAIGWTNGKTRFWIGPADAKARSGSIASVMSVFTTMLFSSVAGRTWTLWSRFSGNSV